MACCVLARRDQVPAPAPTVAPGAAADAPTNLIPLGACTFTMGSEGRDAVPADGEGPVRRVSLDNFSIAATTVTNRAFGEFVRVTRYVTEAERLGSSFVFYLQVPLDDVVSTRGSQPAPAGASPADWEASPGKPQGRARKPGAPRGPCPATEMRRLRSSKSYLKRPTRPTPTPRPLRTPTPPR